MANELERTNFLHKKIVDEIIFRLLLQRNVAAL